MLIEDQVYRILKVGTPRRAGNTSMYVTFGLARGQ